MNKKISNAETVRVAIIIAIAISAPCLSSAQTNSWTNSISGYWQDADWSLGVLPGPGQDIFITNAGWKVVAIASSTVANFQGTLSVNSVTISSPTDSFNTLLMNYSGTQTPLTVGGSNSSGSLL